MFSSSRLYLASGVTNIRTTGSVEPYADLNLKQEIDAGRMIGPYLDVTGPYVIHRTGCPGEAGSSAPDLGHLPDT
jgi:hypothetical protein